jgi:PPIC-type PPIASE domain
MLFALKFSRIVVLLSFATLNALAGFAAAAENDRPERDKLVPAGMDTVVVARVGNLDITAEEFLLSYEFGPAFVKKRDNAKERHLNFMIYEKLMALDGYGRGFAKDRQVTSTLKEFEGDLATEELYRDDVLSQVSVTPKEIDEALAKERIHLELKWLFASQQETLNNYLAQLAKGAPFDALFKAQLDDSVSASDRSLETTKFRLEDQNPEIARAVDKLPFGDVSPPIEAPDGFYLVQVTNAWTNPVMTETERIKLQNDLERALSKRKADALSDQYVDKMLRERNPVIVRRTFNALRAIIGKSILPPEKYKEWNLTKMLMSEAGPLDSLNINKYRSETLVRLTEQNFLLEDFWAWYQARRTYIRFNTTSASALSASLQQMVWRSVRDKLLTARAFERGLQNRPSVQKQKQWWQEKIVYARAKEEILKSINITEEQAQRYYEARSRQYRDRHGKIRPYDQVKERVRQDCYAEEMTKSLLHYINMLKSKYPVSINHAALDALPVSAEAEPKAIDIIVAKKGGTFPRPGFPTIDFDWKLWE